MLLCLSHSILSLDRLKSPTMAAQAVFVSAALVLLQLVPLAQSMSCDEARLKCLYRNGCGFSLQSYMVECADLISGRSDGCNARCERALIALASSEGGSNLIDCECAQDSQYCIQSKQRIQVCRTAVFAALAKDSIVSCNTARWICMADPLCSTALDYYHHFCPKLFYGHHCNHRCNNSLSILNRQVNAAKLKTCFCDGTEDFPCKLVKYNTQKYCYGITTPVVHFVEATDSENAIGRMEHFMSGVERTYKRHNRHRYRSDTDSASSSLSAPICLAVFLLNLVFRLVS